MKTRKTLLVALVLGAMTVPSVFAYDDIDGVNYNIKDPNIGTYVERQPDGTTTSKLVLRKELMGVEGIRLVSDNNPASSFRDSGYIGGSSVIMKTVDKSTADTMEYARMESGSVDLVRHENGQDVYTTRVSYGGFTNTNRENKKIDIMHGTINISDYSNDAHDHDITLGLEHGLYQGDMTERNGSRLTKDKLTISKANGEEEYDDYGNDITKKFTADYDLNGVTVANEQGNIKFTTSGINAGNQKIEGVAAGVAETDAVNVKQLNDKIGALKDTDTITNVTAGPNITVVKSATPGQNGMPESPTFNVSLTPDVAINSANFSNTDTNIETDITATGILVNDPNGSLASMNNQGFNVHEGTKYGAMQNDHIHFGDTSKSESADYSLKGIYLADNDSNPINITKENISFGDRQLHDVKAGTADTDAVNVKQLKDTIANIKDNDTITTVVAGDNIAVTSNGHNYTVSLDQATKDKINAIDGLNGRVDSLASKVDVNQKEARRGIASASALAALHPLDYNPEHKVDVMAGVGHYRGNTAVALGAAYRPNENVMFTVGASINGRDSAINAGVSYKVGTKDGVDYKYSKITMQRHIDELNTTVAEQNQKIEQLNNLVEKLLEEVHQSK